LAEFEDELTDRFGPVPPALASLLALVRLRLLCARTRIARLDAGPHAAAFTPCDPADVQTLADVCGKSG
jgi:transcription-repair coupling factor (superfamily II helicase)